MPVLHAPDSNFSKESIKFEAQYTPMGPPGRPYVKREYPMMVFLAGPPAGGLGPIEIIDTDIMQTADDRADELRSRGFRPNPNEAIAVYKAQQVEFATLAAERNADVRHMSEGARAEVAAAEADAVDHLPSMPETPIKRRGRPRKEAV